MGGSTCGSTQTICGPAEPGRTIIATAITLTGTTAILVDVNAAGISVGIFISIDDEIMRVDAVVGDALTVKRAQAGTVVATHPAGAIVAVVMLPGLTYTFSFRLTNPSTAQASPTATVSVGGSVAISPSDMVGDIVTVLHSVSAIAGDARPLQIYNGFVLKRIGQETPFPGSFNSITVSLSCNTVLSEPAISGLDASLSASRITISGLTGTLTADTATLSLTERPLDVNSGTLTSVTTASSFTLAETASQIAGAYEGFSITVDTAGNLETVTVLTYSVNRIVTLSSNLVVAPTTSSTYLVKSKSLYALDTRAAWMRETGRIVMTVASGKALFPGVSYGISFTLQNPIGAQSSPSVSISASGTTSLIEVDMDKDTTTILHVAASQLIAGEAQPLFVQPSKLLSHTAGQSSPYPYAQNTITVTFAANVALDSANLNSLFISGLSGSTTSAPSVPLTDTAFLAGAISSVTDASTFALDVTASSVNSIYEGYTFQINAEVRVVSAYDGLTRKVTLSAALTTPPSVLDAYSLSARADAIFDNTPTFDQGSGLLSISADGLTTLVGAVTDDVATVVTVSDAAGAGIVVGAVVVVGDEAMLVTRVDTNTLTVVRARGGTAAKAHTDGATVSKSTLPGYIYLFSLQIGNPAHGQNSPELFISSAVPVKTVTISGGGSGYAQAGEVQAEGGGGGGFAATFAVSLGGISSVTITDGGSGFTSAPNASLVYPSFALTAASTDSDLTLSVSGASAASIVANALIRVNSEVMLISLVSGDFLTLTVARAQEGTSASAHASGDRVRWHRDGMDGSISALTVAAAGSGYEGGTIQVYLCVLASVHAFVCV